MKLEWKQIMAAFLIGSLAGGAIGSRFQRAAFHKFWRQGPRTERMLRKFTHDLDLDAQQQDGVKTLLEKQREKIMALHREKSEQFHKVRAELRSELRRLLTPEQQMKFDKIAARWDGRRKRFEERERSK